jgi:NAD(P)H-nitrite reductase large subunit
MIKTFMERQLDATGGDYFKRKIEGETIASACKGRTDQAQK